MVEISTENAFFIDFNFQQVASAMGIDVSPEAAALKRIASKHGVPLIDFVALFGMKPDPTLYCPDGLHPGPAGHQLIIEQVLNAINNYS